MSWRAFVDESEPDSRSGSGVYLLAAALIALEDEQDVQAAALGLRLKGQLKAHWHDEDSSRRKLLIEAIAGLPALHLVIVRTDRAARPERRRRHCLAGLLSELQAHGVAEVYFESREKKQNAGDLRLLNALRAQKRIGSQLRMYHQPGPANPLLWIPDVVAGAVGADFAGNPTYLDSIRSLVTLIEV